MTTHAPRFWRCIPQRYRLTGTHCTLCNEYYFPPRTICPNCRRDAQMVEHKFKGTGTVVTYTIIHNATEDFERQTPYNLAIIELDEGPRLTGQVVSSKSGIKIGMRVRPVFRILGKEGERGIIYYGTKFVPIED
ncbi:MAG TPA: Zn-ribbon domain-containing OB-fold protein [Methanotrichaceae archaeon]|nr:Zn-ribbon domain-containing OB-fold protein [Methanotrichaceae archaeon]